MIFIRGLTNPVHNDGTEAGAMNYGRTERLLDPHTLPYCEHCAEVRHPIHMPGDGWAVIHVHEPHCPQHEDNAEAHEVHFADEANGGARGMAGDS